jgi:hypothetical protein
MEVNGQLCNQAALPLGKEHWYLLDNKLDGINSLSDVVEMRSLLPAENQTNS